MIPGLDGLRAILKPLNALITFVIAVVVASLSYHLMERPALNLKDRFFSVRKPKIQGKTISIPADT
jgi:peptidoglycan/LPS O-acetylase OafA/YrhL